MDFIRKQTADIFPTFMILDEISLGGRSDCREAVPLSFPPLHFDEISLGGISAPSFPPLHDTIRDLGFVSFPPLHDTIRDLTRSQFRSQFPPFMIPYEISLEGGSAPSFPPSHDTIRDLTRRRFRSQFSSHS
ncbi:hypothetical protein J6590_046964 [Homalodisca vitripennis]|nr:hypothetical protein J6590_046964 [Homalodisca vitripennis]